MTGPRELLCHIPSFPIVPALLVLMLAVVVLLVLVVIDLDTPRRGLIAADPRPSVAVLTGMQWK